MDYLMLRTITAEAVVTDPTPVGSMDFESLFTGVLDFLGSAVTKLQEFLPIESFTDWLMNKVPFLGSFDKPLMVFAVGVFVLWVIVGIASDAVKKHSAVFGIGLAFIALAGYLGYITW